MSERRKAQLTYHGLSLANRNFTYHDTAGGTEHSLTLQDVAGHVSADEVQLIAACQNKTKLTRLDAARYQHDKTQPDMADLT